MHSGHSSSVRRDSGDGVKSGGGIGSGVLLVDGGGGGGQGGDWGTIREPVVEAIGVGSRVGSLAMVEADAGQVVSGKGELGFGGGSGQDREDDSLGGGRVIHSFPRLAMVGIEFGPAVNG
jgi:hypothetical protein